MLIAILVSNVAARVRTQADHRDRPGADHRIALCLQPQARGHRDARRRAVGDRLPDRADAEGARGAAVAGGRRADGQGRLSAGGRARQGRSRRRQLGLGQRPPRRARLRYAAGRQAAVPADAHRARADRRHRHRRRQDRSAADAGPAPPARCAGRSGRARDRARAAGRGHGPRQAHRRVRPAALGAADLDLARSEDAAGLGARRRLHDARSRRRPDRRREARPAGDRDRRIRAAQPLHRQSARHDQARIRRHRAEHRAARCRRDRRQRAAARRQDPGASQGRARARRRPADAGARRRAVRAGAVQPAGQRREICAGRHHDLDPGRARSGIRSRCRSSTRATAFRPTISKACSTSSTARRRATSPRRHRPGPGDFPRLRRGDGRHDLGRQPHRPQRRGADHPAAGPGGRPDALDTAA